MFLASCEMNDVSRSEVFNTIQSEVIQSIVDQCMHQTLHGGDDDDSDGLPYVVFSTTTTTLL